LQWTPLEEHPYHHINTGREILQMVSNDWRMVSDICDAHNQSLSYLSAQLAAVKQELSDEKNTNAQLRLEIMSYVQRGLNL